MSRGGDDRRSVAVGVSRTTTTPAVPVDAVVAEPVPPPTTVPPTVLPRATAPTAPVTTATTAPPAPPACTPPAPGSDFDGFGASEMVVETARRSHRNCALTADTSEQQQRGLMYQDDLDHYDGMIFRFPSEEHRTFWMRNTRIPLSIAFFDAAGRYVSATDMEPCGDSEDCPRYISNGAAMYALEVPKGQLASVGAVPGSRLEV